MSSTCTTGRQGLPSLIMAIFFTVQARPLRSLITMSKRMRGEAPYAVALRMNVTQKRPSAIGATSLSTMTLHLA